MNYREFRIEHIEAVQVGYDGKRSRKFSGFEAFYPDGGSKVFDTLREAKAYIDRWHDGEIEVALERTGFKCN